MLITRIIVGFLLFNLVNALLVSAIEISISILRLFISFLGILGFFKTDIEIVYKVE